MGGLSGGESVGFKEVEKKVEKGEVKEVEKEVDNEEVKEACLIVVWKIRMEW